MQEGLSHLMEFSNHLILISLQKDADIICKFVETIRKMVSVPVLVLLPKNLCSREMIIKAGADVVLKMPYDAKEIELQAYALIRRDMTWELKDIAVEDKIVRGPLKMNVLKRTVFWNKNQMFFVKREFDLRYLLATTPGRVYTYSQIYQTVWQEYPQDDVKNM